MLSLSFCHVLPTLPGIAKRSSPERDSASTYALPTMSVTGVKETTAAPLPLPIPPSQFKLTVTLKSITMDKEVTERSLSSPLPPPLLMPFLPLLLPSLHLPLFLSLNPFLAPSLPRPFLVLCFPSSFPFSFLLLHPPLNLLFCLSLHLFFFHVNLNCLYTRTFHRPYGYSKNNCYLQDEIRGHDEKLHDVE